MKPVIGIVSKNITHEKFYNWSWQRINNDVRYSINKNGALTLGIMPQTLRKDFNKSDKRDTVKMSRGEMLDLITIIDKCDGVVLQGGLSSHNYEEFIAKYCYKKDIPLLAICSGYNNVIRALGGKTQKNSNTNIHNRPDLQYAHNCRVVDEKSLFFGIIKQKIFNVNSIHEYIAIKLPKKLSVVALSQDNQIEVVEAKDKSFYMAIKYHPELLVDKDKIQNKIFKAFVEACKKRQQ